VDLVLSEGAPVYGAITDNWPTIEPYFNETGTRSVDAHFYCTARAQELHEACPKGGWEAVYCTCVSCCPLSLLYCPEKRPLRSQPCAGSLSCPFSCENPTVKPTVCKQRCQPLAHQRDRNCCFVDSKRAPFCAAAGSNCPSILPRDQQSALMELGVQSVQALGLSLVRQPQPLIAFDVEFYNCHGFGMGPACHPVNAAVGPAS
jgi:hypothetical protein